MFEGDVHKLSANFDRSAKFYKTWFEKHFKVECDVTLESIA